MWTTQPFFSTLAPFPWSPLYYIQPSHPYPWPNPWPCMWNYPNHFSTLTHKPSFESLFTFTPPLQSRGVYYSKNLVHLGWIHLGASGKWTVRDEYTSLECCSLRSRARFARSRAFGPRPSACRRWASRYVHFGINTLRRYSQVCFFLILLNSIFIDNVHIYNCWILIPILFWFYDGDPYFYMWLLRLL